MRYSASFMTISVSFVFISRNRHIFPTFREHKADESEHSKIQLFLMINRYLANVSKAKRSSQ